MESPPLPSDEAARLAALRALDLLDTPSEEVFDRITALARERFGVPMALISLVDADRQWFKSRQGLEATETPRAVSFCGHAVLRPGVFEVPDAAQDPRFRDNPLVLGGPRIRFYAGTPISAPDGQRVGTLCVIDRTPRTLDDRDRKDLETLGILVEKEILGRSFRGALARLAESEERFRLLAENVAEVFWMVDAEAGRVLYVNPAYERVLGRPRESLYRDPSDFLQAVHPEDRAGVERALLRTLRGDPQALEYRVLAPGGTLRYVLSQGHPVRTAAGELRVVGLTRDMTAERKVQQVLTELATTDSLTGLANGRHFRAELARESARASRTRATYSVAMMDLDYFKQVNDRHGHAAGDRALRRVAEVVLERIRTTDTAGRLGGDEVAILFPDTPLPNAARILESLLERMRAEPLEAGDGVRLRLTLSAGVAEGRAGTPPEDILREADAALYRAKEAGRDRVACAPAASAAG